MAKRRRYSKSLGGELHTELRRGLKALRGIACAFAAVGVLLFANGFVGIPGIPNWRKPATPAAPADGSEVTVHYIDVGQGDCELIQTADKTMLIDAGEQDKAGVVEAYLRDNNVARLDYVVATHPHSDHIGALGDVINDIGADTVIMPELPPELVPTTRAYERLLDAAETRNCTEVYAAAGDTYDLGGGAVVTILAPVGVYKDLNDFSVVLRLDYGETSFLFTGDIEKTAEADILNSGANVSADVLKVAHHGSDTSSTDEFLHAVGGLYAVIGVGSPNSYGHPTAGTLERLAKYGYTVFRTDELGNIRIGTDGEKERIFGESGE